MSETPKTLCNLFSDEACDIDCLDHIHHCRKQPSMTQQPIDELRERLKPILAKLYGYADVASLPPCKEDLDILEPAVRSLISEAVGGAFDRLADIINVMPHSGYDLQCKLSHYPNAENMPLGRPGVCHRCRLSAELNNPVAIQAALAERDKRVREQFVDRPVVAAADAPEATSEAIAILKSAIGDCVDGENHDQIRAKLWQAVEIIYRIKRDKPAEEQK